MCESGMGKRGDLCVRKVMVGGYAAAIETVSGPHYRRGPSNFLRRGDDKGCGQRVRKNIYSARHLYHRAGRLTFINDSHYRPVIS
jgi:hypothetical protein